MKAVLFDLFGTLVDNPTNEQVMALHAKIAKTIGVAREEYTNGWKATFHERSRGLHGGVEGSIVAAAKHCTTPYNEAMLADAVRIRSEFTRDWLTPRPDAISTIASLRERGLKIGLLSNCTDEVPRLWSEHALASVIDEPLFSCTEGLRKPMMRLRCRWG